MSAELPRSMSHCVEFISPIPLGVGAAYATAQNNIQFPVLNATKYPITQPIKDSLVTTPDYSKRFLVVKSTVNVY